MYLKCWGFSNPPMRLSTVSVCIVLWSIASLAQVASIQDQPNHRFFDTMASAWQSWSSWSASVDQKLDWLRTNLLASDARQAASDARQAEVMLASDARQAASDARQAEVMLASDARQTRLELELHQLKADVMRLRQAALAVDELPALAGDEAAAAALAVRQAALAVDELPALAGDEAAAAALAVDETTAMAVDETTALAVDETTALALDERHSRTSRCVDAGIHTWEFEGQYATPEDFPVRNGGVSSVGDVSGAVWRMTSRLQGMNIPIANNDYILVQRFETLAKKGSTFTCDWHQGGSCNYNACTSLICNACRGKLVIKHPGLPSKKNTLADPEQLKAVNSQLVCFLFNGQEIEKDDLLERRVCTLERHFRNTVIHA
jgi:hypothetical protein